MRFTGTLGVCLFAVGICVSAQESRTAVQEPGPPRAFQQNSVSAVSPALRFHSVTPCRQYDSRTTTPLASGTTRNVTLTGAPCGIPATAQAVSVNIAVFSITGATGNGVFTVGIPLGSSIAFINYPPAQGQIDNSGAVPVDASGNIAVSVNQGGGTVQFVLDVNGYYGLGADGPCYDTANRFVDCGNGTVTDTVTGLIWLKQANCFSSLAYTDANMAAAGLQSGQCGLSDGSSAGTWRLPTLAEWQAISTASCASPSLPDAPGTGCYATGTQWATNVQSDFNWASTSAASDNHFAMTALLTNGTFPSFAKGASWFVWPVRSVQ